ncbi:iron ABC transporter permease [uncultured Pseudokineococcus sp.]|uniref:iron ABC transporter permease n=1 Tax=uncultured Pseudokineococcus sp. TaxID=1642928 RepID=UPI0026316C36|nr:iron ABC transporter permease [uncultured Pseudokineococcus sp.]
MGSPTRTDGGARRPSSPGAPKPAPGDGPAVLPRPPGSRRGALLVGLAVGAWLVVAVAAHLAQGTAEVDVATLLAAATGQDLPQASAVLLESRLPRLAAALVVGGALGLSGAAMQSASRNPLASPDTTGVAAGAHLAMTAAAALGLGGGPLAGLATASAGGLAAAALVIGLSGGALSPVRLVLAGSVLALGLAAVTSAVLLLFPWETQGLYAWGAGSLSQNGTGAITAVAPVLVVATALLLLLGRRLDLLQLGEDQASVLGVPVGSTRRATVVLAVVLAACAVTVAGPVGFVGLCAPALLRLLARRVRVLRRQRVLLAASGGAGVALVLSADVVLRAVFGPVSGVTVPTGVLTSVIGAAFLVLLAQRLPGGGDGESLAGLRAGTRWGRAHPGLVLGAAGALLVAVAVAGVLLGDSLVLLGDVANWLRGVAAPRVEVILGSRVPRVGAALLAGACLALAGAAVQAVTRNPLADPGILGVSASAGLGAVAVITLVPLRSDGLVLAGAGVGAALAAVVLLVAGRGGQLRTVLAGIGTAAAAAALTTLLVLRTDPWSQTTAITWLGGSTYGATVGQLVPMALTLAGGAVVWARTHRDLDLLQLDDTTPHVLGVDLPRARLLHVGTAVVLTAAATAGVGVIAFVGLVAPHAARLLVGKRHDVLVPLAVLLGAALVVVGDLVGRTALAPAQLPAGLVVSLVGTPYFLWLLRRMRAA